MNSPFNNDFKVTQIQHEKHDGLDLVGLIDKNIYSTVNGVVEYADWENVNDKKQGFGKYVKIIDEKTGFGVYFGHLSEISVKVGDKVKITDKIGVMGSTGHSTGEHCHYCVRKNGKGTEIDISEFSGIPNKLDVYNDGYKGNSSNNKSNYITLSITIDGKTYNGKLYS